MADWHAFTVEETYDRLRTSPLGIGDREAAHRLEKHGPNELVQTQRISKWAIPASQFAEPLVLVAAAVISVAIGVLRRSGVEFLDFAYTRRGPAGMPRVPPSVPFSRAVRPVGTCAIPVSISESTALHRAAVRPSDGR